MTRSILIVTLVGLIAMGSSLSPAAAQGNITPEDAAVLYRQQIHQIIGNAMKSVGQIVKGQAGDPSHLPLLTQIMATASKALPKAWEDKAEPFIEKTTALPKIWDNWKDFSARLDALQSETMTLAMIADRGDMAAFGPQLGKTGKVCKDCHEEYREKK